jgi:tetratricopeptide (TPR) repeat protein
LRRACEKVATRHEATSAVDFQGEVMNLSKIFMLAALVCTWGLIACGPETIWVRPNIDTPTHHIDNGYKLMAYGKIDAAVQEFTRAMELNPRYSPAYVGLGMAYGMQGNPARGRELMRQAQKLAQTDEERREVAMGFEGLEYIEEGQQ